MPFRNPLDCWANYKFKILNNDKLSIFEHK